MTYINKQIAERLGWKDKVQVEQGFSGTGTIRETNVWVRPDNLALRPQECPRWDESFDAIHRDLLPVLTEEQWDDFLSDLMPERRLDFYGSRMWNIRYALRSSPEQLCRAWLAATETKTPNE